MNFPYTDHFFFTKMIFRFIKGISVILALGMLGELLKKKPQGLSKVTVFFPTDADSRTALAA